MSRIAVSFVLAAGLFCPAAYSQANPPASQQGASASQAAPAVCSRATTLDELIKVLDDAISGPADKDRACLRHVLYPDGRFIPVGKTREGIFAPHELTVDAWVEAMHKRGNTPFYEHQIKVKSETYGHIAHLWSTYELRSTPDGKADLRGINSIQAVFDGIEWRIMEILWQAETPTERVPEKYLP
jgi:hypothetical protein